MKEKLKPLLLITCLLSVFIFQDIMVYAFTFPDTSTAFVNVTIKANVPDGYTESFEIAIYSEVTGETIITEYSISNAYTSTVLLPNKCMYHFMMMFKNEDYTSDIEEDLQVNEESTLEITFNVISRETPINGPNADNGEILGIENVTHGEESATNTVMYDESLGLETPEYIYNTFIDKTSFIEDTSYNVGMFYAVFCGEMAKKDFLNNGNLSPRTEEVWNNMSHYEKFIYKMICLEPYLEIVKKDKTYPDTTSFVTQAFDTYGASYLDTFFPEKGQVVRDALEEVWIWEYKYYGTTGMFYDFYEFKYGTTDNATVAAQKQLDEAQQKDEQELAEAQQEIMNNLTVEERRELESEFSEEKGMSEGLKANIGTIILIIAIIILLAYIFTNKKANKGIKEQHKK